jgi:hypothetical protein
MEIAVISVIVPTRNRAHTLQRVVPSYARGNGYREATDYQMNLFVSGELLRPELAHIALALLDRRARLGASPAR